MKDKQDKINNLIKKIQEDLNKTVSTKLENTPSNREFLVTQIGDCLREISPEHTDHLMEKALNSISRLWSGAKLSEKDISNLEEYGPMAFTHLYGVEIAKVKYRSDGEIECTLKEKIETIAATGVIDIDWELPEEIEGSGEEEVAFIFKELEES